MDKDEKKEFYLSVYRHSLAHILAKAVMEIYAGRDYYDRMVGVVMTNQYFTQPAVELAKKLNIMLWDRGYLDNMDS